MRYIKNNQNGFMLVAVLSLFGVFLVFIFGIIGVSTWSYKLYITKTISAEAIQVAEAGANYYRWLLYHNGDDFCNGEACQGAPDYGPYGPYQYEDSAGKGIIGYYELYIIPPQNGSTIVTVRSRGWIDGHSNNKKEVEVKLGIPSWSRFSTLCDANIRFGSGTEVWGPIHSNQGIRFDGLAHNLVSSSLLNYDDPDHGGSNEFGVHTHVAPTDPAPDGNNPPDNVPSRPDVFAAGRSFPVIPPISFDLLNNYATTTLSLAEDSGIVLEHSGAEGYHITLNTNDTIDIKVVTSITNVCTRCGWQCCWTYVCIDTPTEGIASETNFDIGVSMPSNGIIFVKDKIWVDGQINGARITIVAMEEPFGGAATDIILNNDLTYTNYDGTDAIGLIAQRNISAGLYSENNLQIDAALIAKEGRIGREYFNSSCSGTYYKRNSITINGSLATRNRYGFSWTCGGSWCSGYNYRYLNYDNNLTFAPPPYFPTTGEYTFISWEEK